MIISIFIVIMRVILYSFDVNSRLNIKKDISDLTEYSGTMHGDELSYLFR